MEFKLNWENFLFDETTFQLIFYKYVKAVGLLMPFLLHLVLHITEKSVSVKYQEKFVKPISGHCPWIYAMSRNGGRKEALKQ